MMQVLPILGTATLVGAAAMTGWLAMGQRTPEIPIIGADARATPQGADTRQIQLVPNARDDAYYTAIVERPLFEETRRPVQDTAAPVQDEAAPEPEADPPAPPAERPVPDVRLLGVLSGGARTASLLSVAGDDPQWRSVGDDIDGWNLSEIAASHVLFTDQERAYRVELYQR